MTLHELGKPSFKKRIFYRFPRCICQLAAYDNVFMSDLSEHFDFSPLLCAMNDGYVLIR